MYNYFSIIFITTAMSSMVVCPFFSYVEWRAYMLRLLEQTSQIRYISIYLLNIDSMLSIFWYINYVFSDKYEYNHKRHRAFRLLLFSLAVSFQNICSIYTRICEVFFIDQLKYSSQELKKVNIIIYTSEIICMCKCTIYQLIFTEECVSHLW